MKGWKSRTKPNHGTTTTQTQKKNQRTTHQGRATGQKTKSLSKRQSHPEISKNSRARRRQTRERKIQRYQKQHLRPSLCQHRQCVHAVGGQFKRTGQKVPRETNGPRRTQKTPDYFHTTPKPLQQSGPSKKQRGKIDAGTTRHETKKEAPKRPKQKKGQQEIETKVASRPTSDGKPRGCHFG